MTEHRPPRWRISENAEIILDEDNGWVMDIHDLDKAKRIARAVNAHDRLIAALEGLLKFTSDMRGSEPNKAIGDAVRILNELDGVYTP